MPCGHASLPFQAEHLPPCHRGIKHIASAHLTPADGRAAVENGSVAAWVIWEPFLAALLRKSAARILLSDHKIASFSTLPPC